MENSISSRAIRRFLALVAILAVSLSALADELRVDVSAPSQVAVGRNFQIAYVINDDATGCNMPEVDGLTVLMGPSSSRSSSYSIINGKMESSKQTTFTYVVKITKAGTITIPAAKINAAGKSLDAKPFSITAVDTPNSPSQNPSPNGQPTKNNNEDLFLRQSLTRSTIYEGEALSLIHI